MQLSLRTTAKIIENIYFAACFFISNYVPSLISKATSKNVFTFISSDTERESFILVRSVSIKPASESESPSESETCTKVLC